MNGSTIIDYIERLRAKPEHVRHRIAFGTAAGITGVVGVVWVSTLIFSGALALSNDAPGTGTLSSNSGNQNNVPQTPFSQLLGAVGVTQSSSSQPALTTVDTVDNSPAAGQPANTGSYTEPATTTTAGTGGDQTSIPF